MTHNAILSAIYTKLSSVAGIPTVLYPNITYATPPEEYLRVAVMPLPTETVTYDNGELQYGLFQVDCVTRDGIGEIKAAEYAELIISSFKNGTVISGGLKVTRAPFAGAGFNNGAGRYVIPVTVRYSNLNKI